MLGQQSTMNRTILLVEDNPDDVALTIRALRKSQLPHELVIAHNGLEALDYLLGNDQLKSSSGPLLPRVVLLDLKLPNFTGLETLHRLRSEPRTRLVPVIVLTSSREPSDIAASYDLGANSYIRKPVDFEEFINLMKTLGTYWLDINEPPLLSGDS
jgi:two-component system response regulator